MYRYIEFLIKTFTSILLLVLTSLAYAKQLSPIESQIVQHVALNQEQQLAFLEQLVNLKSPTDNIKDVINVGEIVRQEFEKIGFTTFWINSPQSIGKAGTLIAEHKGTQGKHLLLISHLDTVLTNEKSFKKFQRANNLATGTGIIDDKGGISVILYALKALHETHSLDHAYITVVLTGDEEDSGQPTSISRKALFNAASHSDIALDFEWAVSNDTATIARRGITDGNLQLRATRAIHLKFSAKLLAMAQFMNCHVSLTLCAYNFKMKNILL
jgi:glutamate carboxypeptidase